MTFCPTICPTTGRSVLPDVFGLESKATNEVSLSHAQDIVTACHAEATTGIGSSPVCYGTFTTCPTPLPAAKNRSAPNFATPSGALMVEGALAGTNWQIPAVPAGVVTTAVAVILRNRQLA